MSSKSGHVDIVNVLLSHGADTDVKNEASKYSDITSIKNLLLTQYKETSLHLSSKCGHVDIVKVLLSQGADIHVGNKVSKTYRYYKYQNLATNTGWRYGFTFVI